VYDKRILRKCRVGGQIGELVGGSWFAWEMGCKIGLWWHMVRKMGDGSYEV